jgi:integrase/recombinase XerC
MRVRVRASAPPEWARLRESNRARINYMDFQTYLTQHDGDKEKSPLTIKGYCDDVAQFAKWFAARNGEELMPGKLNRIDAKEWLDSLNAKPTTLWRKFNSLLAYVRYGKHIGAIHADADPLARINLPTMPQNFAPRSPSDVEAKRLMAKIETLASGSATPHQHIIHVRTRAVIIIAAYGGLRVSELASLKLQDLFLQMTPPRITVIGKGGTHGEVPATSEMIAALTDWLAIRPADAGDTVFGTTPRAIQRDLSAHGIAPHRLRHLCARRLTQKFPIDYAQAILRHKDIRTTLRYTRKTFDELYAAANSIA